MPPYERNDLMLFAFVPLLWNPSAFHLIRHGFAVPPSPPGEGFPLRRLRRKPLACDPLSRLRRQLPQRGSQGALYVLKVQRQGTVLCLRSDTKPSPVFPTELPCLYSPIASRQAAVRRSRDQAALAGLEEGRQVAATPVTGWM